MTTNAYMLHASKASQAIAARFKNRDVIDQNTNTGKLPKYVNDLITRINIEENATQNDGPDDIIDVQPDFRNIILAINYNVAKYFADINIKTNPLMTPASMTAYCLAIIYAYGLLNDDENVRSTRSEYISEFLSDMERVQFKLELSNCYVPPFLEPILKGLYPTYDQIRRKLKFVYSFAAFDLEYDYGRTPPISLFLKAHDIMANTRSNNDPMDTQHTWMDFSLIRQPIEIKVGNILGTGLENGDYNNYFAISCNTIINYTTVRSNTQRHIFAPIPQHTQEYDGINIFDVNPYIYLLNVDETNITTTTSFMTNMSKLIQVPFPGGKILGDYTRDTVGDQLIDHYYTEPTLPTYHKGVIKKRDATHNDKQFSTAINFCANVPEITSYERSTGTLETQLLHLTLSSTSLKKSKVPDPDVKLSYIRCFRLEPLIRHFCPRDTSNERIALNIITGKVIETSNLAGVSVPQPNPKQDLERENSYFLESAIPFTSCLKLTSIGPDHQIPLYKVTDNCHPKEAVSADLYDRSQTIMPHFNPEIDGEIPEQLPGFNHEYGITSFFRGSNNISFRLPTENDKVNTTTSKYLTYAWSSYRWLNHLQDLTIPSNERRYFITNFRTIYGTNITLVETEHPARIIKRA